MIQKKPIERSGPKFRFHATRSAIIRLTLTALFIAMALAIKPLTKQGLSSLNVLGIQVSFGGIFTFFPAILFGPLYGGLASAMVDFLGAMIWPTGTFIPWLTLTAFAGGVIKGYVWKLITGNSSKILRYVLLVLFIFSTVIGASIGISLSRDGIIGKNILSIKQENLPTKAEIEASADSRSNLSNFAIGLARYNQDASTLKNIDVSQIELIDATKKIGKIVLPSEIEINGLRSSIKTLNLPGNTFDKLFEDEGFSKLIIEIPSSYTKFYESCFEKHASKIEIHATAGSDAATFVKDNQSKKGDSSLKLLTLVIADKTTEKTLIYSSPIESGKSDVTVQSGEFTVRYPDSYRKNLAKNLNLAISGFMIGGLIGIMFIGLTLILDLVETLRNSKEKRRKEIYEEVMAQSADKNSAYLNLGVPPKKKRIFNTVAYIRILLSILISGLFVTTVNTPLLIIFVEAYKGQLFSVFLIPRICEEIVVCIVQAYLISLIYTALTSGRLGKLLKSEIK